MLFSTFAQDIPSSPFGLFLECPTHSTTDFFLFNLSPEILENMSISPGATFRPAPFLVEVSCRRCLAKVLDYPAEHFLSERLLCHLYF